MKRVVLISVGTLLVAVVLILCFTPLLVAGGLRIWAQRLAHREGLQLEIGEIEAPFLRPVTVRNLKIRSDPGRPFKIDCAASRLELGLNFAGIFTGGKRPLRNLHADGITLVVTQNPTAKEPGRAAPWSILENLLADSFKFSAVNLHLENGFTTVDVRDAALTGSELEAGTLTARETSVSSPWFHQTFSNLRGATSWQENRLSLGAVSLVRGLDIDTIAIDLSRIGDSRIGMEVSVDAFGGKLRARVSSDDRGGKRTWDIAGNGSGVSLAQMSDALGWTNRASGSLHASKFTFRGEMNDLRHATAAIWAEVSGLTWRDRTADTVMIGAALYNREVQVEQLYIKQRNNQLTLTGDFAWPERWSLLAIPAFRADLSASINDLGEFARLFGWDPSAFAGSLTANASIDARAGKFGGQLSASANSLVLFHSPIESLDLKIGLMESRLELTQFELHQKDDFLRLEGNLALTADRAYTAAAQCSVGEIADYRGFIPAGALPFIPAGSVAAEWKARGANNSDSGTIHLRGRSLHDVDSVLAPFEAEAEADYSPDNLFFRQLHLWNSRTDLSAFVTVAKDYFHVQDLRLVLNNHPHLQANVYLPLSVARIRGGSTWLAALSADPFFDIDVNLDALNFAELAAAIKTKPDLAGSATGQIQLSGTPASLQGQTEFHLHDFVADGTPRLSADIETRLAFGLANIKANAVLRSSEPVKIEGTFPLQLKKGDAGYAVATEGPLSLSLDFPAIFLANVPRYFLPDPFTRGILSGSLNVSDRLEEPLITGDVQLVDGKLLRGTAISAAATFKQRNATVHFLRLIEHDVDLSVRGEVDFTHAAQIDVALMPNTPIHVVGPGPNDCVSGFELVNPGADFLPAVERVDLRGALFAGDWKIDLTQKASTDAEPSMRSFAVCRDGKTLSFAPAPAWFP